MNRVLVILLGLCVVAIAVMTASPFEGRDIAVWSVLAAMGVLLIMLFRGVVLPMEKVTRGYELVKAQDFGSRLSPVHEPTADRVVDLFNGIIDRLRAERLKNLEQEGFLGHLVEASPMGIVTLDLDGRISQVNPAFYKITGLDSHLRLEGAKPENLVNPLVGKMLDVPLGSNDVFRVGDVRAYRCWHLSFLQTGFSRQFYMVESLTEELMRAERAAYEKVIRVMNHEVNNTMGGVRSVLTMLADSMTDSTADSELSEVLRSCDERCGSLCEFIKSYADVVRLPEPVRSSTDLSGLIRNMAPFLHTVAGDEINLQIELSDSDVTADIDTGLMEQAIVNIVKNAAESFAEIDDTKDRFISVAVENQKGSPTIVISNNGPAISDSVSRNLFSPFFSTKRDGRGIGLTLTAEILRMHGAVYSLRTDPNGLTRFTIRF